MQFGTAVAPVAPHFAKEWMLAQAFTTSKRFGAWSVADAGAGHGARRRMRLPPARTRASAIGRERAMEASPLDGRERALRARDARRESRLRGWGEGGRAAGGALGCRGRRTPAAPRFAQVDASSGVVRAVCRGCSRGCVAVTESCVVFRVCVHQVPPEANPGNKSPSSSFLGSFALAAIFQDSKSMAGHS